MEALRTQELITFAGHKEEVFNIAPRGFAFVNAAQASTSRAGEVERDQVFVSYSHHDAEWLGYFQTMLKPLTRNRKITLWDDTKIRGGDKWKEEIRKALSAAKVAVLLVSPHFLASDFIAEHELPPLLKAAEEQGVKILWVMVSDCLYRATELSDFQAAHNIAHPLDSLSVSERNRVLRSVCEQIAEAATQISPDPS